MVLVITDNRVNDVKGYLPLAKKLAAEAVQNDKGCQYMDVYVDPQTEGRVVFVSRWDTKEDWQAHAQGKTFQDNIPAMAPYYVSGTDTFLELA